MAWLLGPAWFRMFQNQVSPEVGRKIAIIYLNGLLVGYALGLTGSVGSNRFRVLVIRMRTRRERAPAASPTGPTPGPRSNDLDQPSCP